jgi:hypothetical protein
MPDESCRTCGGELISYTKCSECRKPIQRICKICGTMTEQEYHQNCLHTISLKTTNGMHMAVMTNKQSDHKTKSKNNIKINLSLRNLLLVFNIIGFFVLGFATSDYFNLYQSNTIDTQIGKSDLSTQNISLTNYSLLNMYENCLGYGKGKSITITCPTEKGYVYKTTLAMPHDLVTKLATDDFSIRSLSISENSDGSVVLEYQKNQYATTFF